MIIYRHVSPMITITVIPKKWRDSNGTEYIHYQWQGGEEVIVDDNPYSHVLKKIWKDGDGIKPLPITEG